MKITQTRLLDVKKASLEQFETLHMQQSVNLAVYNEVVSAGHKIVLLEQEVHFPRDTALVLADLAPEKNWAHPCQYLLFDADSGELYDKVDAAFPPKQMRREPGNVEHFHAPVKLPDTLALRLARPIIAAQPGPRNALAAHPGQRYAILYSGDSNNRHVNDVEFLYRTLIDRYAFAAGNIFVLNHDGTINYDGAPHPVGHWPGDNTAYRMVVNGQGTRAAFQNVFNNLAGVIQPEDLLFIHTNNHGAGPGDGVNDFCLCAYDAANDWVPYFVNDFVADLGVLPQFEVLMVMMEQCRSGGFITPILTSTPARWTHIATAVAAPDYSLGGANFDPFAEDWIAGINGQYQSGGALAQVVDTNGDGMLSAIESFNYADAVHHPGDTPTQGQTPVDVGGYIFLGLPAHDLFLRDNLEDHGREPLIGGGISCSPDIVVYNQELLDPDALLGTPAAQNDATLGELVEAGQDNFVYLRVFNRGGQATGGTATAYWTLPSVLPTPASWHLLGSIALPTIQPGHMEVVGPIIWDKNDIPAPGHYCFVGLIQSGDDPAPDKNTIHTIDDFYRFIRENNNATWKNFDVQDMFANSLNAFNFQIQGWPRTPMVADLVVDVSELPAGMETTLRMLKRLSGPATLENLLLLEDSQRHQRLRVTQGGRACLHDMPLQASDNVQATLEVMVPDGVADGTYRVAVSQVVGGREMGRVTRLLAIGDHPFLANHNSREVHVSTCQWAQRVSPRNKSAYQDLERALQHGFDGCHFCLPEFSKD